MLVALYVAYALYLVLAASDHDALPWYSGVMLLFVLPLVAITMVTIVWRRVRRGSQQSTGSGAGP
jgi:cation:H+ antiporter